MHSQGGLPAAVRQRWGLTAPSGRGPRSRLTLDEVVTAAVELADDDGFEAVTLAALASRVGLTTTAIYRYVDSKDTLSELMVDDALGAAPALHAEEARDRVHAWVDAAWHRYEIHPWLATFPIRQAPRCPHAFAWLEVLLVDLTELGVDDPVGLAMAVDVLVRGYAGLRMAGESPGPTPELAVEIGRRHPVLAAGLARDTEVRAELRATLGRLLGPL